MRVAFNVFLGAAAGAGKRGKGAREEGPTEGLADYAPSLDQPSDNLLPHGLSARPAAFFLFTT
jgi:hypothetical protein